jgi:hypothetical protein
MSNCFDDKYTSFEYTPCIRKGKHKPKHKKKIKYEAKIQKTNLIHPIRHKLVSENFDIIYHNKEIPNDLIQILLNKNATKWKDEYEFRYQCFKDQMLWSRH